MTAAANSAIADATAALAAAQARITELEALLAQHEQLEDKLAYLATFPEQNPNAVIETDRQGRVTYSNPVAQERFPELADQGSDHPLLADLSQVIAELERNDSSYLSREIDLGDAIYEQKICFRSPTNHERVRVFTHDLTERRRAEHQAIRAERLAMLGLLSGALAHEINNPLQIIQSHLELLMDFPLGEAERQRDLGVIRLQIGRLNTMTRRILDFSRPRPMPVDPISVTRLLRQVLVLAARQLQQQNIRVTTDFQLVPPVLIAPESLDQVILNLILNALESLDGVQDGHIQISVRPESDRVAVAVASNGPSIPDELLPRIFDPLYTTKPKGSGLGLWISRNLIQQYGGTLTAANQEGQRGVVFTVELPAAGEVAGV